MFSIIDQNEIFKGHPSDEKKTTLLGFLKVGTPKLINPFDDQCATTEARNEASVSPFKSTYKDVYVSLLLNTKSLCLGQLDH